MAGIRITEDTLSPATRNLAATFASRGRVEILEAMGLELRSMTIEAFQSVADRPAPWAPKKDGSPSNLVQSTALRQSFQVRTGPIQSVVTTDRIYAAAHQFGSTKRNLPARPFYPFLRGELTGDARRRLQAIAEDKLRSLQRRG